MFSEEPSIHHPSLSISFQSLRQTTTTIIIIHDFFFSTADFYGFFFHAIPEEQQVEPGIGTVLTLPELHELVSDVWLTRHDAELEEERAARRKGRPKSAKEQKLEEVKLREAEEYRTGMGECPFSFLFFFFHLSASLLPLSEIEYAFFFCFRSLVDATRKIIQRYRT